MPSLFSKYRLLLAFVAVVLLVGSVLLVRMVQHRQSLLTKQVVALLNTQFKGTLSIRAVTMNIWKQFPYLSLDLQGVRFYATSDTNLTPMYSFDDVYLGVNILELLREEYRIKRLSIDGGHIDLVKFADGRINILEAKGVDMSSNQDSTDAPFTFDMKNLSLNKLRLAYHDYAAKRDIIAQIDRLETSFTLAPEHIIAEIKTALVLDIDRDGKHTFFNTKHCTFESKLDYNLISGSARFENTHIGIEQALFALEGAVDTKDSMNCSVKFHGEKPSLLTFAAFAPSAVQEALKTYSNEGNVSFSGKIDGKLLGKEMPAYRIDFSCDDAYVVNTAVNKKVQEIYFSGMITNGEGRSMKTSEFRLRNFRAKPEVGLFRGDVVIRNFDDPYINVNVNADLDFEFLAAFSGIEGLRRLKGQILLDMNFNELVDIDKPDETLLRLKEGIDSELRIKNLSVQIPDYPHPITNINGHAVMKQGAITLDDLSFTVAGSDVHFDGTFSDIPALLHEKHEPIEITLNMQSKRLQFQELLAFDSTLSKKISEDISGLDIRMSFQTFADELRRFRTIPRGTFILHHVSGRFKNYPHEIHDIHADIVIDDTTLTVKDISGMIDKSDVRLQASVENYPLWLERAKKGTSRVRFSIASSYCSLKDILSYEGRNYVPEQYRSEEIKKLTCSGSATLRFDSTLRYLQASIEKLNGDFALHAMKLKNSAAQFHIENSMLTLDTLRLAIGASEFGAKGTLPLSQETLTSMPIRLDVAARQLDLDELLMIKQNALRLYKQSSQKPAKAASIANSSEQLSRDSLRHATAFSIVRVAFPDAEITANIQNLKFRTMRIQDCSIRLRTAPNHTCTLDTLYCRLAEGKIGISGIFQAPKPENITLAVRSRLEKIRLESLLLKFDNFGQDNFISDNITGLASGVLNGVVALHPDLTPIVSKSEARIDVVLKQGELLNFAPMQAMTRFFRDKNMNRVRFDTLKNTLTLKDGKLTFPQMTINSSLGYIELSGEQSIQRSSGFAMDYVIGIPFSTAAQAGWSMLFGTNPKDTIPQNRIDAIQYRPQGAPELLIKMRMQGKPGALTIRPGGK